LRKRGKRRKKKKKGKNAAVAAHKNHPANSSAMFGEAPNGKPRGEKKKRGKGRREGEEGAGRRQLKRAHLFFSFSGPTCPGGEGERKEEKGGRRGGRGFPGDDPNISISDQIGGRGTEREEEEERKKKEGGKEGRSQFDAGLQEPQFLLSLCPIAIVHQKSGGGRIEERRKGGEHVYPHQDYLFLLDLCNAARMESWGKKGKKGKWEEASTAARKTA